MAEGERPRVGHIAAVVITRDAANTLDATLASLRDFDEVVVLDNGSTDGTPERARQYPNVALHEGTFKGFGPTKNEAIALAERDWVLSVDADEAVSEPLSRALAAWVPASEATVGVIRRDNYFMGRRIKHAGWGGDRLVRLFNRRCHQFTEAPVHEKVATHRETHRVAFDAPLSHRAVEDLGQFLVKVNRYSDIRKTTSDKTHHPALIFAKSAFAFVRSYLLKAGFLDGWRGLVIAVSNANGVFFKYMKVYARKHADQ